MEMEYFETLSELIEASGNKTQAIVDIRKLMGGSLVEAKSVWDAIEADPRLCPTWVVKERAPV